MVHGSCALLLLQSPLVLQPVGISKPRFPILAAWMHFQGAPVNAFKIHVGDYEMSEGPVQSPTLERPLLSGKWSIIKIPVQTAFKSRFTRRAFSAPFPHLCDPSQLNTKASENPLHHNNAPPFSSLLPVATN